MHPPKVFISATSGDLRSIRQIVKEALLTINCHPVEQTNFQPDWRTVEGMLSDKIADCQALIHIAGMRYGAEPNPDSLPPGTLRRSYTQMEYHLGRKHGLRVYTFILPDTFNYHLPGDADASPLPPEADDVAALQLQHRQEILASSKLYESPTDPDELRLRILAIPECTLPPRQVPGSAPEGSSFGTAPPLPTAFFSRPELLSRVSSGMDAAHPRLRIIQGGSGTGKSSLAAEFYHSNRSPDSAWIDCRVIFECPKELSKFKIVVLDNVGPHHPALRDEWLQHLREAFVVATTSSPEVVRELCGQAGRMNCPDTVIAMPAFSAQEKTDFLQRCIDGDLLASIENCIASSAISDSPMALQLLRELAVKAPTVLACYDELSLRELVESWSQIADSQGACLLAIECLAAVPFAGMDEEAMAIVTELTPATLRGTLEKLKKLGMAVEVTVEAGSDDPLGRIVVLHDSLRELFSKNTCCDLPSLRSRYGELMDARLKTKSAPGILTCVDAWLAGWNHVFESHSAVEDRHAQHQERLELLTSADRNSWSAALLSIPTFLMQNVRNLADEDCPPVIGLANMVSQLPMNAALARMIFTGALNRQDFWARGVCIAAAVRHWRRLQGPFLKAGVNELKNWLKYANQQFVSEQYIPEDDKTWSADFDLDYLPAVCGIMRLTPKGAADNVNEAISLVTTPDFSQRFERLTLYKLAIIFKLIESGTLTQEGLDTTAMGSLVKEWCIGIEDCHHRIQLTAGTVGRYALEKFGIRIPEFLDFPADSEESHAKDIAHLTGSDELKQFARAVTPKSSFFFYPC